MSRYHFPLGALLVLGLSATQALVQIPAAPATSLNVNVNVPSLVELVRTPESRKSTLDKAIFLGQSAKYLVGDDAVTVEPPTDIKGFIRQALKGQASVLLNTGIPDQPPPQLDVQVLASDWGALTVQIRNPLVPKLPLVGLPDTPPLVSNMVAPLAAQVGPGALQVAQRVAEKSLEPPSPPFWTTPIQDGTVTLDLPGGYHHAVTPLDIVGTSSLALGAAYGGSYAYYVAEMEREAQEAEDRKKAAAAKREAAAKKVSIAAKTKDKQSKKPTKADTKEPAVDKTVKVVAAKTEESPKPALKTPEPAKEESKSPAIVLPAGEPQLKRTIGTETSIALAQTSASTTDKDDVAPVKEKKKAGILRRFFGLFRRRRLVEA